MPRAFRFGAFELDIAAYVLRRGGVPIKLERVPMEVLILLVESAGNLVERSQLRNHVWGSDVFVDQDAAINTAMRKIRRVLGDDSERPRFIETVVGKGYRFIGEIEDTVTRAARADGARRRSNAAAHDDLQMFYLMRGSNEIILPTGETIIGRLPSAGVHIDHPSVSRRHAAISIDTNRAVLRDLKSRNGTFVDGRRVTTPTPVLSGSVIGLGPITLRFVVRSAPRSTQPMTVRRTES
jgi:DNA-binding winged helix-turn-helix (wHTH) protein